MWTHDHHIHILYTDQAYHYDLLPNIGLVLLLLPKQLLPTES